MTAPDRTLAPVLQNAGVTGASIDVFGLQKPLAGGGFPRSPERHSARRKGGRPKWSVPGSPSGSRRARLPVCAHRIQSLRGDAEQAADRPVGERAIRRLEATLEPPSRAGIAGLGATHGRRAKAERHRLGSRAGTQRGSGSRSGSCAFSWTFFVQMWTM